MPDGAAEMAEQALEIAPRFAPAWFLLGRAREARYARSGRRGDHPRGPARLRQRPRHRPGGRPGRAPRASRGSATATRSTAISPAYVRALFDAYAPRFDRHLVEGLALSRARAAVAAASTPRRVRRRHFGTGARPRLRHRPGRAQPSPAGPAHLTGIDLSPGMLAAGRAAGLLPAPGGGRTGGGPRGRAGRPRPICVTAADVLIYVRRLCRPMLSGSAARPAARAGASPSPCSPMRATASSSGADARYAHGDALVREPSRRRASAACRCDRPSSGGRTAPTSRGRVMVPGGAATCHVCVAGP